MKGWFKWILALFGFSLFGIFGAVIGFAVGSMIDARSTVEWDERFTSSSAYSSRQAYQRSSQGDFASSLLVLTAAVMRADGKVMKSELEYVKNFYIRQFGVEKTRQQMITLQKLLKDTINVRDISHQIRYQMQYHSRLQLLHYLFGIAGADEHISDSEVAEIQRIAGYLGLSHADFLSIKAMFVRETGGDFKILEISPDASNDEVKKAYRKMAMKFHPDKVAHLGADVKKQAEEKFRKVQEAYENIKKQRGFS
ncbi:MAG: molecular chaperone DjlA [Flavobacteriales bacterium]|nr:molecular chaperone DjlA [Flavobacteriales bacterium]|tara:strand:- start:558 stop:1316 length:759 start_codon:yes stop_codon:yes gene_type:complete